jgi:hypothetical protein
MNQALTGRPIIPGPSAPRSVTYRRLGDRSKRQVGGASTLVSLNEVDETLPNPTFLVTPHVESWGGGGYMTVESGSVTVRIGRATAKVTGQSYFVHTEPTVSIRVTRLILNAPIWCCKRGLAAVEHA